MNGSIPNGQALIAAVDRHTDDTDTAPVRDAVLKAAFALVAPEQVADFVARRVIVEQATGMVMMIYAVDAERAFDFLEWRSETTFTEHPQIPAERG